ncbi:MAG: MSMEG_0569 family flavin-dependent oxidoreductase [Chthoniobacteraceae bacterium]
MSDLPSPNVRTHYPVIIIGGGQAGLSMSYCLKQRGIDHLVFEKNRLAESWRTKRWDSFCLVTPNWQCQLPGFPYAGPDPNGFMVKDEIVAYIEAYARSFDPPLREGVEVSRLRREGAGVFELTTDAGTFTAEHIVIATGGYQEATTPPMAQRFPARVTQIHSSDYKNTDSLPPGEVLVVGSGQSGCQIAEDLHLAGRKVHLCVGGAPRTARRYRGKDVVDWLHEMGYYDKPIDEHPQKERVRAKSNHYVTGRGGGRDIDLRKFALEGMKLYGRLNDLRGSVLHFADDLKHNLDQADAVSESIKTTIDKYIDAHAIAAPEESRYQPVWQPENAILEMDYVVAGISSIVWCVGYHADYRWIELSIFDGKGYPGHERGVTTLPGVYFLGLPWQYTWGSGRFVGVARDAEYLAERIAARPVFAAERAEWTVNEWALGS